MYGSVTIQANVWAVDLCLYPIHFYCDCLHFWDDVWSKFKTANEKPTTITHTHNSLVSLLNASHLKFKTAVAISEVLRFSSLNGCSRMKSLYYYLNLKHQINYKFRIAPPSPPPHTHNRSSSRKEYKQKLFKILLHKSYQLNRCNFSLVMWRSS